MCYPANGKKCHLFPLPSNVPDFVPRKPQLINEKRLIKAFPWICYLPGIYRLCQALTDTYKNLLPALDHDGDRFSPAESLRGSIWRGRDCSDFSQVKMARKFEFDLSITLVYAIQSILARKFKFA